MSEATEAREAKYVNRTKGGLFPRWRCNACPDTYFTDRRMADMHQGDHLRTESRMAALEARQAQDRARSTALDLDKKRKTLKERAAAIRLAEEERILRSELEAQLEEFRAQVQFELCGQIEGMLLSLAAEMNSQLQGLEEYGERIEKASMAVAYERAAVAVRATGSDGNR